LLIKLHLKKTKQATSLPFDKITVADSRLDQFLFLTVVQKIAVPQLTGVFESAENAHEFTSQSQYVTN